MFGASQFGKDNKVVTIVKTDSGHELIAIGGAVTRAAKPPKRGVVVIREATAEEYEAKAPFYPKRITKIKVSRKKKKEVVTGDETQENETLGAND